MSAGLGTAKTSRPVSLVVAEKSNSEPASVIPAGIEPPRAVTSASRRVPALVPSLFHSSRPAGPDAPSSAVKNSVPSTSSRRSGPKPPEPGTMSFTSTVPALVPSLFHSSKPVGASASWRRREWPRPLVQARY